MNGYNAFITTQTCAYDVVAEYEGKLIRIQVKSTQRPHLKPNGTSKQPSYSFSTKRVTRQGHLQRQYDLSEFDMYALVALDIRKIAYVKFDRISWGMTFRVPELTYADERKTSRQFDDYTFESAVSGL